MTAKMPYLNEDEIVVNGKTTNSHSSASDIDDAEESFFENKVISIECVNKCDLHQYFV